MGESDSAGTGASGGASGGGERFDLGDSSGGASGGNGGESSEDACEKIDFLFVIDNSGSMADEQAALIASFGGFIDTIRSATGARDFQIMVVDSDGNCPMGNCVPETNDCNTVVGAGRVTTPNGQDCGIDSGRRYMLDTQPDLENTFACAAGVGTNGSGDEKVLEAMAKSMTNNLLDPGQCNEGFIRDDAILVVTIITDEEDDHETPGQSPCGLDPLPGSLGEPDDWFNAVQDAKLGTEENAVVLSLVGPTPPDTVCPPLDKCAGGIDGAEQAPRIVDFTNRFTRSLVGPVCDASYEQFFADAVALVAVACDEFVPPG